MFEKNQKNDPAENDQKRIYLKLRYEWVYLDSITCFNKLTFRVENEHKNLQKI